MEEGPAVSYRDSFLDDFADDGMQSVPVLTPLVMHGRQGSKAKAFAMSSSPLGIMKQNQPSTAGTNGFTYSGQPAYGYHYFRAAKDNSHELATTAAHSVNAAYSSMADMPSFEAQRHDPYTERNTPRTPVSECASTLPSSQADGTGNSSYGYPAKTMFLENHSPATMPSVTRASLAPPVTDTTDVMGSTPLEEQQDDHTIKACITSFKARLQALKECDAQSVSTNRSGLKDAFEQVGQGPPKIGQLAFSEVTTEVAEEDAVSSPEDRLAMLRAELDEVQNLPSLEDDHELTVRQCLNGSLGLNESLGLKGALGLNESLGLKEPPGLNSSLGEMVSLKQYLSDVQKYADEKVAENNTALALNQSLVEQMTQEESRVAELEAKLKAVVNQNNFLSEQLRQTAISVPTKNVIDSLKQKLEDERSKYSTLANEHNLIQKRILALQSEAKTPLPQQARDPGLCGSAKLVAPAKKSKLPLTVFRCIECYVKGLDCDNGNPCTSCKEDGEVCARWICSWLKYTGSCDRSCNLVHDDVGWLMTKEPVPQW